MQRILLVDDDTALRRLLRLNLTKMGYTVAEASNGKEALAKQESDPVELVLTDLIMPEKEGLETIPELRRKYPQIKIIAMSGGGRGSAANYLKIAKMMGADRVMTKPFSYQELAAAIAQIMPKPPE
jgi:DNA-binding response OmpR family regulator